MLIKQSSLLSVYISKEDVEALLNGEKLQVNNGEYAVMITLEDKK